MKTQVEEDVTQSKHRLIGEILVEMGAMNASQVMEVLNSMDKRELAANEKVKVRE